MIYKVIIQKTVYVEADSEGDAKDCAFNGDTIEEEELISKVRPMYIIKDNKNGGYV